MSGRVQSPVRDTGEVGKQAAKWHSAVDEHFGFVIRMGFTHVDVDDSSFWSIWTQYRSESAAIRISRSNEFTRSEVHLIRLVDGEVPPYPIWITDERIDWALLDTVVEARQPSLLADVQRQSGLKPAELDQQLRFWAQALLDVAGDFLTGDFAPVDEAAAIIRSRLADSPQKVQVWLPDDAPEGAEAQESKAVASTLPPNVGVSVKRYRRGLSR